jgi:hypothetical protein
MSAISSNVFISTDVFAVIPVQKTSQFSDKNLECFIGTESFVNLPAFTYRYEAVAVDQGMDGEKDVIQEHEMGGLLTAPGTRAIKNEGNCLLGGGRRSRDWLGQ